jgi:hypothetical protein
VACLRPLVYLFADVLLDVDHLQHLRLQAPELRVLPSPQYLAAPTLELALLRLPLKSIGLLMPPAYLKPAALLGILPPAVGVAAVPIAHGSSLR